MVPARCSCRLRSDWMSLLLWLESRELALKYLPALGAAGGAVGGGLLGGAGTGEEEDTGGGGGSSVSVG